jgi:hypothetical protein
VVGGLAFWVDDLAPDHGELLLHGGRAARQEAGYSKKGTPIRSPKISLALCWRVSAAV